MAKDNYNIRLSIDRSILDSEISLSPKNDGTVKPKPLRVLLFWAVSGVALIYFVMNPPLSEASFTWKFFTVVWWITATVMLGAYSKTKEMRFSMLPALMDYTPRGNREIHTRKTNSPTAFFSVAPYRNVDDSAKITFADGTVGRAYAVVGNASLMVFPEDRNAIVDRAEGFWRKVDEESEFIFLTTKEPQKIDNQVLRLKRQYDSEQTGDKELRDLMHEDFDLLRHHVGDRFRSIHQYLIIKSNHEEALRTAMSIVTGEVEGAALMLRSRKALTRKETLGLLGSLTKPDYPAGTRNGKGGR